MIDALKRAWRDFRGPRRIPGEDEFGFVPRATGTAFTPGGRALIGHQRNSEGLFNRVFSDGSGVIECRSPRAFSLALCALHVQIVTLERKRQRAAEQKKASRYLSSLRQRLSDQRFKIEQLGYLPTGFVLSTHAKLEIENSRMAIGRDV